MCFMISDEETKAFQRKHKSKPVKVYKILELNRSSGSKPELRSVVYDHTWLPGDNEVRYCTARLYRNIYYQAEKGLYVYLQRPRTGDAWGSDRVVAFTADPADLGWVSDDRTGARKATFGRLHLSEKEYLKAMK